MKVIVQKYNQNDQEFYSLVLPFETINKLSEVLIYGESSYGYQRKLDEKHYQKIKKSLIEDQGTLPTSVILGVNKKDFEDLLTEREVDGLKFFVIDTEEFSKANSDDSKLFRIIDGQHRIAGLKLASSASNTLNNFPLNVIIVVTEEEERVKEVVLFRDINSKGKKLKMDLTLLAMYNYELLKKKSLTSEDDIIKHILIRTAHYLNTSNTVWKEAIQFDIYSKNLSGIIGVAAFINSILPFVKKYIQVNSIKTDNLNSTNQSDIIGNLDNISQEISNILIKAWEIVEHKWAGSFENKEYILYGTPRYKKDYYIQKTTGVNAIHLILTKNIKLEKGTIEDQLLDFRSVIINSPLTVSQWKNGGVLSGLTSKSGFSKAQKIIEVGFDNYQLELEKKASDDL